MATKAQKQAVMKAAEATKRGINIALIAQSYAAVKNAIENVDKLASDIAQSGDDVRKMKSEITMKRLRLDLERAKSRITQLDKIL